MCAAKLLQVDDLLLTACCVTLGNIEAYLMQVTVCQLRNSITATANRERTLIRVFPSAACIGAYYSRHFTVWMQKALQRTADGAAVVASLQRCGTNSVPGECESFRRRKVGESFRRQASQTGP